MAFAIFGTPVPQFTDDNGGLLNGGLLYIRDPGTNALVNTYPTAANADAATNANTNPIVLDARGQAKVWGVDGQTSHL